MDCDFPAFLTGLLLLNASIFFVLFMNFYYQNYKKTQQLKIQTELTEKSAAITATNENEIKLKTN